MRADLHRALRLLTMGRSQKALLVEVVGVIAVAISFWIVACAFVLLEPSPRSAQHALGGAAGPLRAIPSSAGARPASYALSNRFEGTFAAGSAPSLRKDRRDA